MIYLTPDRVLDDTLTMIQDNSTTLRVKLLAWFNLLAYKVMNERRWYSLQKKVTSQTITTNAVTLPSDFESLVYVTGLNFFFDTNQELTDEDIFLSSQGGTSISSIPVGYGISGSTLTFYPDTSDTTCDIKYNPYITSSYQDNTTATIFPVQFLPLFVRTLVSMYDEFDSDERTPLSISLNPQELSNVKKWDNQFQPLPKRSKYMKDRL